MSNEFNKLLLEIARQVIREEEEPKGSEKGAIKDAGEFSTLAGSTSEGVLNVDQLITNLVIGTELKVGKPPKEGDQDKRLPEDKDFHLYRLALGLKDVPTTVSDVKNLEFLFSQVFEPDMLDEDECATIEQQTAKFLVRSSMSRILGAFNRQSAGFVNERLLAGLLGGVTVPLGSDTIADILIGDAGVSLKLIQPGPVEGSVASLLETLGIPLTITGIPVKEKAINPKTNKKTVKQYTKKIVNTNNNPRHTNGLFYILSSKTKDEKISVTMFEVKKDVIIEILKGSGAVLGEDNITYEIAYGKFSKFKTAIFLGSASNKLLANKSKEETAGVSDLRTLKFELQRSITASNAEINLLGEQMRKTLQGLNKHLTDIKTTITTYCLNPSYDNYNSMLKELKKSNTFQWEKLTSDDC